MSITLTTPVGRIVQGELWKPQPVIDAKTKQPKLGFDGKQLVDYFFALAIPKNPGETHWANAKAVRADGTVNEWGRQIWEEGHRAHPNFAPHPTFSWKIEDGDSTIPNKKMKKNCDREGFPGHWILKLRSGFPIPTYNANGTAPMAPEAFKTGHYVQVNLSVKGNTGDTPGIYLNPLMVALSGYGQEIANVPDASEAGFGADALPAGASAAPLANALPTPAAVAGPAPVPMPTPTPAPSLPVMPNPGFVAGPGVVATPPVPTAPVRQMTAKAQGTYEAYVAAGWNDQQLRDGGYIV